jgi:ATP-dependent Clp protease ATP-binding subunit ClpA
LFENIGQAHSLVLAFLGKVLRKGYIIDPSGKRYHLSNIIFILNLTRIGEEIKGKKIGFVKPDKTSTTLVIPPKIMNVLDWVDEIIEFVPLSKKQLSEIAREKLMQAIREIQIRHHANIRIHDTVFNYIASRALKEGHFAHSVGVIIEREFRIKILDLVSKGECNLKVDMDGTSRKPDIKPAV